MKRQRDPAGALLMEPSMWQQFTDFANVLKAFIGTAYLALPFAFYQSGLVLGGVGVLVIALITDHCCQLVLKCKGAAVSMVLESSPEYQELQNEEFHEEMAKMKAKIEREMMLGDIGKIVVGAWGVRIVNISLVLTQLGFCTAYLIFIGNTIKQMFPLVFQEKPVTPTRSQLVGPGNFSLVNMSDILDDAQVLIGPTSSQYDFNSSSMIPPMIGTSSAPMFVLLALIPLPVLILMAYIRKIRLLGPISGIANFALLSGFVGLLVYMLNGLHFKLDDTSLANVATFPVFFGQLTGAYEGIGVIIPIESSMENNRPSFKLYLHLAIGQVSVILGSFGILGYLIYGSNVPQIVTDTLPSGVLAQGIRVTLIIAVLFTYPLQLFPVIEILEDIFFTRVISNNKSHLGEIIAGPSASLISRSEPLVGGNNPNYQAVGDHHSLDESVLSNGMSTISVSTRVLVAESEVLLQQPDLESSGVHYKTSAWKRNVLRTILVLFTAGLAILLKDDFAYVNALIGSMGSSVLAYVLPALCHLMLFKNGSSWGSVIKDVLLIIFGVVGGIMGVVITVQNIVADFESRSK